MVGASKTRLLMRRAGNQLSSIDSVTITAIATTQTQMRAEKRCSEAQHNVSQQVHESRRM
eukprot:3939933-Rhodomonas_salina.2